MPSNYHGCATISIQIMVIQIKTLFCRTKQGHLINTGSTMPQQPRILQLFTNIKEEKKKVQKKKRKSRRSVVQNKTVLVGGLKV